MPRKRPDVAAIAAQHPPPPLSGRAALFAVPAEAAPAERATAPQEEAPAQETTPPAARPEAETPAAEPASAAKTTTAKAAPKRPSPRRPSERPISREADIPISRGSDVQLERSYVLDTEHDRMLHEMAVVTGLTVQAVLQEALAGLLEPYEGQDLRGASKSPIPAGPEPTTPVRRTVSIRQEQDRLLRSCRMLFRVQASDVVRQAIVRHYEAVCGEP